jgi:hypothetical protein
MDESERIEITDIKSVDEIELESSRHVEKNGDLLKKVAKHSSAVVILIIIAGLGVGVGVWGAISTSLKNTEINNLQNQITDKDEELAILHSKESIENDIGGIQLGETESCEVTLLLSGVGNCLNCETPPNCSGCESKLSIVSGSIPDGIMPGALRFYTRLSDGVVQARVDWDKLAESVFVSNAKRTGLESMFVSNLPGRVVDVTITIFGQGGVISETALFLMSDGTVEYMPIRKAVLEGELRSYGKLPNVKNVIGLRVADIDGYHPLAQQADGNYYDLTEVLQNTGNY